MSTGLLNPRAALPGSKTRQVQDAKNMQQVILERTKKKGIEMPDYEFLELTGKGSYGRVYLCKNRKSQQLCAVKIIEIDNQDYKADSSSRDTTLKEFINETTILQTLKARNPKNINIIHEAFSVDSQLWIVSDYCPGGALSTLMKAFPKSGIGEEFIVPIAREVAVGLKYVHDAGIIHRDIKCANILVHEAGEIQLCDFGISAVLENQVSKRSTIVGTPHWMAPELAERLQSGDSQSIRYGAEVDIWAFGCAVYEMATGHPPNAKVHIGDLGDLLHREPPRLSGELFTEGLKDFVAYCLAENPDSRPSADTILSHRYIANTSRSHPTESISKLVVNYRVWEQSGGQRASLFNAYGAQGPEPLSPQYDANEDWNFSTTLEFDRRISMALDPFNPGNRSKNMAINKELTPFERAVQEARINRGRGRLERVFKTENEAYSFDSDSDRGMSDLPFRNFENGQGAAADRTTLIDLDAVIPNFAAGPNLDLPATIKAKKFLRDDDDYDEVPFEPNRASRRATKDWKFPGLSQDENLNRRTRDWKFPTMMPPPPPEGSDSEPKNITSRRVPRDPQPDPRNRRTKDWKFPTAEEFEAANSRAAEEESMARPGLAHAKTMPTNNLRTYPRSDSPDRTSLIDLDHALAVSVPDRTLTQAHSASNSAVTDFTTGDPFDLEDEIVSPVSSAADAAANRTSLHMKSQSEPSAGFALTSKSNGSDDATTAVPDSSTSTAFPGGVGGFDAHGRSSSMNRSSGDLNTARPLRGQGLQPPGLFQQQSGNVPLLRGPFSSPLSPDPAEAFPSYETTLRSGVGLSNEPFSEDDARSRRRQQRRGIGSGGATRARRDRRGGAAGDGASGPSSAEAEEGTLRPARTGPRAGPQRIRIPQPYEPRREALLPGASHALRTQELKGLCQSLAEQTENIMYWLRNLRTEDGEAGEERGRTEGVEKTG